jgi:hypothetical protein
MKCTRSVKDLAFSSEFVHWLINDLQISLQGISHSHFRAQKYVCVCVSFCEVPITIAD